MCVRACACTHTHVTAQGRDRGRENLTVHPADQSFMRNKITKGSKEPHSSPSISTEETQTEVGCGLAVARIHFMEKGKKESCKNDRLLTVPNSQK